MKSFADEIKKISPEHDTPFGVIHPYWARKPLNLIQKIISNYSQPGDLIIDPFAGSGTTVFAALSQHRKVIASDINPLSVFLIESLIDLCHFSDEKIIAIRSFVQDFSNEVLPWFHYRDNLYVERERFKVHGSYEDGNFWLTPSEVVLKTLVNGRLKGRLVEKSTKDRDNNSFPKSLLSRPVNFKSIKLLPNSRIAIPKGATLAHYYEERNQAAINLARKMIISEKHGAKNSLVLSLLLSSSLPQLRLSDKKATSQWPYWRPKTEVTSRNPVAIFHKKLSAIEDGIEWARKYFDKDIVENVSDYFQAFNLPIQSIVPNQVIKGQADLVITDPPYSDQAPYLEYSALWINILGLDLIPNYYDLEIVQTDAPDRINHSNRYTVRLSEGLRTCAEIIKENGVLVWFYQDNKVSHWALISEEATKNRISIDEVIPLPKQRRSLKTVTSPGKTLDGDLILIFRKTRNVPQQRDNSFSDAMRIIKNKLDALPKETSYFEKYATVVETGLKYHLMSSLAGAFGDIKEILNSLHYES